MNEDKCWYIAYCKEIPNFITLRFTVNLSRIILYFALFLKDIARQDNKIKEKRSIASYTIPFCKSTTTHRSCRSFCCTPLS